MDQNIQQTKFDPKVKAITSLILGLVSLISGREIIYIYMTYEWAGGWILLIYFIIPLLGIIFGKMSLTSTKKGLGIVGIILSIIGLFGTIFFYIILAPITYFIINHYQNK